MSEDQFTKLFKYVQIRFDELNAKLDTKADKAQTEKIYELVDGIASNLIDTTDEQAMVNHRHEQWITQLAKNTGAKLVPEQ